MKAIKLVLSALALTSATLGESAQPIPIEVLFRASPLGEALISPDGRHLGLLVNDGVDSRSLLIYDLQDSSTSALRGSSEFDIQVFRWISNDKLVFSLAFDKVFTFGLYAAKLGHLADYTPIDKFNASWIIGVPEDRPGRVLVWLLGTSGYQYRADTVVELDADFKAPLEREAQNGAAIRDRVPLPPSGTPQGWWADCHGEIALCRTWDKGRYHLWRYSPAGRNWREVQAESGTTPMGMDYDDRFAWVVTFSAPEGYSLRRCNMETGVLEEPSLQDRAYDIGTGHLHYSKAAQRVAGVTYLKSRPVSAWFLKSYAVAQASFDKLHPDTDNVLVDHDREDHKFVFQLTGSQHPGSHELLDLEAKKLRKLGDADSALAARTFQPVRPIYLKMRDGVTIEAYVTLPAGASPAHPVPMVVLAHGGPWARDQALFNPEVQFLASRGYAVLQPNYRGSTGYSPEISHERIYHFIRMHDDVTDSTRGFLESGLIDPKRVAIMGGSFGGYLAVSGAAREPNLYCCAITVCGVFDWKKQIEHDREHMERGLSNELLDEADNPHGDLAHLDEISVLAYADRIHVPVLIAHGLDDGRVDVEQSHQLAKALQRRNVPVETYFKALEGHGFYNYESRVSFYRQVETFLATNFARANPR